MAKKSEKNESRRESQKKQECPKKKAKGAKKAQVDLTLEQRAALWEEGTKRNVEKFYEFERARNEEIVNTILDIGYVFCPEEGKLLDYYLRNKVTDKQMDFCPIKEANIYANHPQALTGKSRVPYFFTNSRPNDIQPGTGVQGHWICGEKKDIFYQDQKIGVKQVVEYCEAGHKCKYKIIEYQLDPAPDYLKTGPWFICKLENDWSCVNACSGP